MEIMGHIRLFKHYIMGWSFKTKATLFCFIAFCFIEKCFQMCYLLKRYTVAIIHLIYLWNLKEQNKGRQSLIKSEVNTLKWKSSQNELVVTFVICWKVRTYRCEAKMDRMWNKISCNLTVFEFNVYPHPPLFAKDK